MNDQPRTHDSMGRPYLTRGAYSITFGLDDHGNTQVVLNVAAPALNAGSPDDIREMAEWLAFVADMTELWGG